MAFRHAGSPTALSHCHVLVRHLEKDNVRPRAEPASRDNLHPRFQEERAIRQSTPGAHDLQSLERLQLV
jgi:hypothetical protein